MAIHGWNSAKAVGRAHTTFEILGIVSFALALIFEFVGMAKSSWVGWATLAGLEILRFAYGRRETKLSEIENARLQQRIAELSSARRLSKDDVFNLRSLLEPHAGTRVDIFVWESHLLETHFFADQLHTLFGSVGWQSKLWHRTGGVRFTGASLSLSIRQDEFVRHGPIPPIQWLMVSLSSELSKMGIECTTPAGGFDPRKMFEPWELAEHAFWNTEDVAPFRVEVWAKQHIPLLNQIG
jgi:hypothetical protein